MNFSFHNKLNIKTKTNNYTFYNTILKSTLNKLSSLEKFNEFLSIGNGIASQESQNKFHLTNKLLTTKLINSSFQSDITKGSLFAKYEFVISKNEINENYITEIGLSNNEENPLIFNYFSLISTDTPNGIYIQNENEIVFEVTIYLTINENNYILLTSGNNPFIEFLLGNGLGDVYISKGTNYSNNERINREITNNKLFLCNKTTNIFDNSLEINFEYCFNNGEIDEILFISENKVFARKNLKEFREPLIKEFQFQSKDNYIIKIEEDIKSVNSIINTTSQTTEQNCYISKYANSFGDKINLPFDNLFNNPFKAIP